MKMIIGNDEVTVDRDGDFVTLEVSEVVEGLTPSDARRIAAALLTAAREVEESK